MHHDLDVQPFPHCVDMIKAESASEFKSYTESLRKKKKDSLRMEGTVGVALASVRKGKKKEGEKQAHELDSEPKTVQVKHRPSTTVANLAFCKQYTSMLPFENFGAYKVCYWTAS